MINYRRSPIFMLAVVLCIFTSFLSPSLTGSHAGIVELGVIHSDLENDNLTDGIDFEDDVIVMMHTAINQSFLALKLHSTSPVFQQSCLALASPPPKTA
jgi:hypothetical protein